MKKNRPGTALTVLARPHDAHRLAGMILIESSAIGVRLHETRRLKLRRELAEVQTCCGTATVKLIYHGERLLRIAPEFESCRKLAEDARRPLPEIYQLVTASANRHFGLEE
jgi:uncharacterized protein (DUF111 family)